MPSKQFVDIATDKAVSPLEAAARISKTIVWELIEQKHFGPCVWQHRLPGGKTLLEGLIHKKTGRTMIVEKVYAKSLPKEETMDWPNLANVRVFMPVDANSTWGEGLDDLRRDLADYK